jgi:hypothetical protein
LAGDVIRGAFAVADPDAPRPFQVADGDEEHAARASTPANAKGAMTRRKRVLVVSIHPWCPVSSVRQTNPYPCDLVVTDISRGASRTARPAEAADQNAGT